MDFDNLIFVCGYYYCEYECCGWCCCMVDGVLYWILLLWFDLI